jgi:uncharacterized membrane protein
LTDVNRSSNTRLQMRFTAAVLTILFLAAIPAQASLEVCNKAKTAAKVALGHFDGKTWVSRGWWTVKPGACETLLSGALEARYYYLFGSDGGSGTWGGDTGFCTQEGKPFAIAGRGNCAGRGFDSKGFFQIDTGDKTDFRQSLSD